MAYLIRVSYWLSERGRREALKAGLEPEEVQQFWLKPNEPGFNEFAELVDVNHSELLPGLPNIIKMFQGSGAERFIPIHIGEAYGFRLDEGVAKSTPSIVNAPDHSTQVIFDAPQSLQQLLAFERKRQAVKRKAYQSVQKQLEILEAKIQQNQLDQERFAEEQFQLRFQFASQWLQKWKKYHHLPAVKSLSSAIAAGKDPGIGGFDKNSLMHKAADAVRASQEHQRAKRWIERQGSRRLKLILSEGFLPTSMNIYREERLASDYPNWEFPKVSLPTLEKPRNPSEEALECLLKAREDFPSAKLLWAPEQKFLLIVAQYMGRQIIYSGLSNNLGIPF